MIATQTATPELHSAAQSTDAGWLSKLIDPWTADRPDPAHSVATMGLTSARRELVEALAGPEAIVVVSGPTGHGKTLLLRSLRTRPPNGFVPMFVPFSNVEPGDLAGWILETAGRRLVRAPAAELARLLRANSQFGGRTLLLMDEVQATPCATLSKLFEIITEARAAVSVVLSGLPGDALDRVLTVLPHSARRIAVSKPWNRADAELLLTEVARELRIEPSALIAAVDVDAALGDCAGNPRLVRASLGARVGIARLARDPMPLAAAFAPPRQSVQLAAFDGEPPGRAIPIPSPAAPASARSQRPPAAVRAEPPRGAGPRRSTARQPLGARASLERAARSARVASKWAAHSIRTHGHRMGGVARARTSAASARLRSRSLAHGTSAWNGARAWARQIQPTAATIAALAARMDRDREAIAASWKRAVQMFAAAIIRLQRSSARQAPYARARLDRAVRNAHVVSARLRSLWLARGAAAWNRAREWARQVEATSSSARIALRQQVHRKLIDSAQRVRGGAWLPSLSARSALAITGVIAALAAIVADGRTPDPAITESSRAAAETVVATIDEPILFRLNSHPWSTIEVDGVEAGTTPFTISLEPGPHHFRVAMADGRIVEEVFVVSELKDRLAFR